MQIKITSEHQIVFQTKNHTVTAHFLMLTRSGRLSVWIGKRLVSQIEGVDYDADYFTNAGLEAAARDELTSIIECFEKNTAPDTFAAACMENSIRELLEAAESKTADATDCETWGIEAPEWFEAVNSALTYKLAQEA
jgi:hypothetical protein